MARMDKYEAIKNIKIPNSKKKRGWEMKLWMKAKAPFIQKAPKNML